MYEIRLLLVNGSEKSMVVPNYGFDGEKDYFWVEEKLERGDVLLNIFPIVNILNIRIVIPKEFVLEAGNEES